MNLSAGPHLFEYQFCDYLFTDLPLTIFMICFST